MKEILSFIQVFQSPSNERLFHDCACYWFAHILQSRFTDSHIVYDPHQVHFATEINGTIYDISGRVELDEDYVYWEDYASTSSDTDMIVEYCIELKGGEI